MLPLKVAIAFAVTAVGFRTVTGSTAQRTTRYGKRKKISASALGCPLPAKAVIQVAKFD